MGSTTTQGVDARDKPLVARRRRVNVSASWLHSPRGEDAALLALFGIIVGLQNLIELPRGIFRNVLGQQLTGLLMTLVLGASLVLLVSAAGQRLPRWRWLRSRRVQLGVLVVSLLAVPTGIGQTAKMLAAGFQSPDYANDGTILDHFAAQELLRGHNPYASVDIVAAVSFLKQDPAHTTPLGAGRFARLYPQTLPTDAQRRATFKTLQPGPPDEIAEFESHVSYPALSFLPLVPVVWAGIPSVVPFFVLCLIALIALIALTAPPHLRPWVGLLALADAPLLDATVAGALDLLFIPLLFVAWRYWRRPWLSAVAFGLAVGAKQIAWFAVPFYAIWVARHRGWREAAKRLVAAGVVFGATNIPFLVNNPHAYLSGILAPQVDRMFPQGNGIVGLSTSGLVPLLPTPAYSALFVVAYVVAAIVYWRKKDITTVLGFTLAVLPLFFAWRSLTTYFYFLALPALGLLLAQSGALRPKFAGSGGTSASELDLLADTTGMPEIP